MTSLFLPAHVTEPLPTHGKLAIVKAFWIKSALGRRRVLQNITGSLNDLNPVCTQSAVPLPSPGSGKRQPVERGGPIFAFRAAALFSRYNAGTCVRDLQIFAGSQVLTAGKCSFLSPLIHDANQSERGLFHSFVLSPVLSFFAARHVKQHDSRRDGNVRIEIGEVRNVVR